MEAIVHEHNMGSVVAQSSNLKLEWYGYEISVAMDNSCGAFKTCRRNDVRVYQNGQDVTYKFFPLAIQTVPCDENVLYQLMRDIECIATGCTCA